MGGFLRRDVNNVYDKYALVNQKKAGIIGAASSNEAVSLGPRTRGKRPVGKRVASTRFPSKVSKGLMRMNLRMKIGSPIAYPVDMGRCAIRKLTVRIRSQTIDSLHHTETEGNPAKPTISSDSPRSPNLRRGRLGEPGHLKISYHVFEQHGNPGKRRTFILKASSSKIKKLNLRDCYKQCYSHSSALKISPSRPAGSDGGKITEKANASGNALDKVIKANAQTEVYRRLNPLTLTNPEFDSRLNSVLHHKPTQPCNYLSATKQRYYTSQNLPTQPCQGTRDDNRLHNKVEPLHWPKDVEIKDIELRVYKKQIELCRIAKVQGIDSTQVKRLQEIMVKSLDCRIVAVAKLGRNPGSRTPGVDGETFKNSGQYKIAMVSRLRNIQGLQASPVRRVFIKQHAKHRPLGIPTVIDRAAQNLLKLILEPLVEMKSDKHSYGFRKYRSAKNAVAILRAQLKTGAEMETKWILDADIEGFFDNINHQWLLDNTPLALKYRKLLEQWLKAGSIYHNKYELSNAGTPQGGIISPILANLTLDGLETAIYGSLKSLTKSKELRFMVKTNTGSKRLSSKLFTVRFADDFVVMARSKHLIVKYVIPAINEFLKQRGLKLSPTKTKIFTLGDEKSQLNFLGYVFKYNSHWKAKKPLVFEHSGEPAIALYPNRDKVKEINTKLKKIISKSQNLTAYTLISTLNPIIRGWSHYFNMGNCSRYRDHVRQGLYRNIWAWCKAKHKRWGKKLIAKQYFLTQKNLMSDHEEKTEEGRVRDKTRVGNLARFKGRRWTFRGITKSLSRYSKSKTKTIYLQDPTNTCAVLASKHYIIPEKRKAVHAFSSDYMKLIDLQVSTSLKAEGRWGTLKEKLLKRDNICCGCKKTITPMDITNGHTHIHHVKPIAKKGSRSNINNLTLMHSWCHREHDHSSAPTAEGGTPNKKSDELVIT